MGKIDNIEPADWGDRFVGEGYTEDIIDALRRFVARRAGKGTEKYAAKLKGKSVREVCKQIWNDLKHKIRYKRDPQGVQNLKSAERLVEDGEGDCKSYSIFTASVLTNLGIRFVIRFAKYAAGNFTHVYIIAFDENNKPIIIDAVWTAFDAEKTYYKKIDYLPMVEIHELTGFDDPEVRDYLEGIDSLQIAGFENDVSGLADLRKIKLPGKVIQAGKGAVQKVVNEGLKPAINWLFQKAITPMAPFFVFQWVKNHPNKEVIRRRDVQRAFLQKVSNFFKIKMDDILGAIAKSIQSKHGKSPQQIIDDATKGKISGSDEIGFIINPATIRLAVATMKELSSYLMKLFGAKVQELSEKEGSDLALLATKGGGRNNFNGDIASLTAEEKSLVMKNGKIIPFFDKDSNQVVDGEWLHPSGRVDIEKVNLQLLKARYTDEELAVVAKNGKIRKIFDIDGNGKVNGEWLKPNGRVDLQKCKDALSGKKKEEKKDDKGKGNGKGGGALPPDNGKGGKKGDDTKGDDKTKEPVTDGNGTGGKEPPTDQTKGGGGSGGGKNNTILYVVLGVTAIAGIGAAVYVATKKK